MDAAKKTRVLNRNRPSDTPQSQRGDRQIVLPMTRQQYDALWHDPDATRALIDLVLAEHPELFPATLRAGYTLHGFARNSRKLAGVRLRKIRPRGGGTAYHLRPSFVMSYMTGTTDALEYPLLLASFGVPCWVLTVGFGHSDMYWHRLMAAFGVWFESQMWSAVVRAMVEKLWIRTEEYAVAYDHAGCRRTSTAVDQPMNRLYRLVYPALINA